MAEASRAAAVEAFLEDFEKLVEVQPDLFAAGDIGIFPAQRKIGVLPENQCDLDLETLSADVSGIGWGRTVMRLVCALADRHGVDVYVKANADDESEKPESIPQADLESFYAKLGFVDKGSWHIRDMVRRASQPSEESERLLASAFASVALWTRPSGVVP